MVKNALLADNDSGLVRVQSRSLFLSGAYPS
jgi:hypothetical protein